MSWLVLNLAGVLLACSEPTPPPVDARPPPVETATKTTPPASAGASAPYLVSDAHGALAAWTEPGPDNTTQVLTARWSGDWTAPEVVASGPKVTTSWADHPVVARGVDGARILTWLSADPADPHATTVMVSRETPQGWRTLGPLHNDGTPTEHGFATLLTRDDGVHAFWLDGRATPAQAPTQLRSATVTDSIGAESIIDPRVCDCCGVDGSGSLLAYRDRDASDVRDITVHDIATGTSHHFKGGWKTEGCPVNGPAIDSSGLVAAVAWFTEAPTARVNLAFSQDGGATWGTPLHIDGGAPQGRVDVALVKGEAVVTWTEADTLHLRRVSATGRLGADIDVGPTARAFPALAALPDGVLLAWQDDAGLQGRMIPMAALPEEGGAAPLSVSEAPATAVRNFPHGYTPLDLEDKPAPFSHWSGQPVLVNLWATWCAPCMQELPALRTLDDQWRDRGLVMLGIAVEDKLPKVKATVRSRNMSWIQLQDSSKSAGDTFGTTMLPTTFLYGRDGTLLFEHTGALSLDDAALLSALDQAVTP